MGLCQAVTLITALHGGTRVLQPAAATLPAHPTAAAEGLSTLQLIQDLLPPQQCGEGNEQREEQTGCDATAWKT